MDPFDFPLTVIVRPIETTSWLTAVIPAAVGAGGALLGAWLGAWLTIWVQRKIFAEQSTREYRREAGAAFALFVSIYETVQALDFYNRRSARALAGAIRTVLGPTDQGYTASAGWMQQCEGVFVAAVDALSYTKPQNIIDPWGLSPEERARLDANYIQRLIEIRFVLSQLVRMHDDRVAEIRAYKRFSDSPQSMRAYLHVLIGRIAEAHDKHGFVQARVAVFALRTEILVRRTKAVVIQAHRRGGGGVPTIPALRRP